uniref:phage baseplate assembly protein V n=1 Tax=Serratia quinivorans TaxID=137545 RepID=UPI0035C74EE0
MAGVSWQVGTISAVDADKVQARVRLPECDNMRTNWLNVLQRNTQNNKDYWLPDVGEQVEVLLDANGEDGVILGAVYSDVDRPPFNDKAIRGTKYADGAEFSYNRDSHTLTIRGGIEHIVIECSLDVMVKTQHAVIDAKETEIPGNLTVGGKTILKGGLEASGGNGAAVRLTGNLEIDGNAHSTGSMLSDGPNSNHHSH